MLRPLTPADEDRRLEALHSLNLLDTPPVARFDRITRLACSVANVPIALICFVDTNQQWIIVSRQGLDATETSRDISFFGHTVMREEPLIVPDTLQDWRFADNPLVTGEPYIRFYAGHPIHAPEGARVGTLCVIDTKPRHMSSQELRTLADLAALVEAEMSAVRFNIATRTVGVGVHERHAGGREMWWSDAMWDIFGQDPRTFRASADNWLEMVHPEDRDHVRQNGGAWGTPRTSFGLQYRIIRPDGTVRYLQSIATTTEKQNGAADRIVGITLDVTDRVTAEQREYGQLRDTSHQAGMAEVATGVLHSIGNVVNSLGIANSTMRRNLKTLRLDQLEQVTTLISDNRATLASFLTNDERGRHLPGYMPALSAQIASNVQAVNAELDTTDALHEHLRDIVSAQEERAYGGILRERVNLKGLLDRTIDELTLEQSRIEVVHHYGDLPLVTTDHRKLSLILVNILNNARDAVLACVSPLRQIIVHGTREGSDAVISIEDAGIGMSPEVLSNLWRFGFSTKPNGRGFNLHNSANAARQIGASIVAHSDGTNKGARFIVRLPVSGVVGNTIPSE